jgi:hypothetical protein
MSSRTETKMFEDFIKSKSYLNEEGQKLNLKFASSNFNRKDVVCYIMENYKGIDQFLLMYMIIGGEMNEGRPDIQDKVDMIYSNTLYTWVLSKKSIIDVDDFVFNSVTQILQSSTTSTLVNKIYL